MSRLERREPAAGSPAGTARQSGKSCGVFLLGFTRNCLVLFPFWIFGEFPRSFALPGDMRREALNFLACPNCGGELALRREDVREEKEHVMAGKLECAACQVEFAIRNG